MTTASSGFRVDARADEIVNIQLLCKYTLGLTVVLGWELDSSDATGGPQQRLGEHRQTETTDEVVQNAWTVHH